MKLTSRGVGAVCITVVTLVSATVLDETVLWPLVAVGITSLACSILMTIACAQPVAHAISFAVKRVHANDELLMQWGSTASSPMSRTLQLRTTKGPRAGLYLHGFSSSHGHLMSWQNLSRGELTITVVDETLVDPMHLVQRSYLHQSDASVLVWPARWELTRGVLGASWDNPEWESAARGTDTGIHTLREYVPGDDPRAVHWLTSARAGTLIVAERTKDTDPRVHVVLDTQLAPVMLDRGADAACSIIGMLYEQRANWSLVRQTGVIESSGRSGHVLDAAFDDLATVTTEPCDVQGLLDGTRRAMRIVVTARNNNEVSFVGADVVVWMHTGDALDPPVLENGVVIAWDVRESFSAAWEAGLESDPRMTLG
jgi:uncharacterized protein (DUF58 family)